MHAQDAPDLLLRYIHPNHIQPSGEPMSLAFRDTHLSVYSQNLGATAELVLDVMSSGSNQGLVYALDREAVAQIQDVSEIVPTPGRTGNPILDAAHFEIVNSGARNVARALRDISVRILTGG